MCYGSAEVEEGLKFTYYEIQGDSPQIWTYNSALDRSISLNIVCGSVYNESAEPAQLLTSICPKIQGRVGDSNLKF